MTKLEMRMDIDFNETAVSHDLIERSKKALSDVMAAIERHAKRVAPVKTGSLKQGIHVEPKQPALEMTVGDDVTYGVYQEFGTSKMKAQPFLRPARDVALIVDLPKIRKKYNL